MAISRSRSHLALGFVTATALVACSNDETIDDTTAHGILREMIDSIDLAVVDYPIEARVTTIPCARGGNQDVNGHVTMSS
ncbi:MAG: hypothetical protein ABW321_04630, partial [Polyangiales bacterium]